MDKYMVIGEEDDGFQFFITYPTKKEAKKAVQKMLQEEGKYIYALPLTSLYIGKCKSLKTIKKEK